MTISKLIILLSSLILSSFSCTIGRSNSTINKENTISPTTSPVNLTLPDYIHSKTYRANISSVLLYKKNLDLSDPVILLNSNEVFEFHFDVLDSDFETFQYRLIHCNEDWSPSDLDDMEYIDGFNDNYIEEFKQSYNTIQQYVHYELEFPNENIRMIKSGNYAIAVYKENEPENIVLTHRFYVTENNVQVVPDVKYPTNLDDKYYKQEIDFNLLFAPNLIINPFSNLKVVIEQNHRTDNPCKYLKPNYAKQDELIFNYDEENVFEGGNEYRHLDLTTVRNKTDRIARIESGDKSYIAHLIPDNKRTFQKYLEYQDINGRFLVKTIDQTDNHLESEYVKVHFTVPYRDPFSQGDLYIYGGFTNWEIDPNYKMNYNYTTRCYEGTAYLKQGYYNYSYIYKSDKQLAGELSKIEGTHFDTENEYTFKIYYADPSDFYDRLLLYYIVNSRDGF
ncbi:MAG: DUF5103 domain-containing protein [Flavobacteriales bacterium]|jgi:hypothetical protein|nr:DUF5103 domain-containing protein [Flavobacteriales bacterium]